MSDKRIIDLEAKQTLGSGDYLAADSAQGTYKVDADTNIMTPLTNARNNIANSSASPDKYSSLTAYKVGDMVIHDDILYICITACSAASWAVNSACFTATTLASAITQLNSDLVDISTKTTPSGVYLNWVSTITPSGDIFVTGGACYMQCAFTCSDALIANVQHIIATIASSEQYPTNLAYGVVVSLAGSAGVIAVKPDGVILVNLSTPLQIGDMLYLDVTWRV